MSRLHRGVAAGLLLLAGLAPAGCSILPRTDAQSRSTGPARAFVYSPYKHVAIDWQARPPVMATAVAGAPTPIVAGDRATLPPGVTTLTLAFATGECGAETWDDAPPQDIVGATRAPFEAAGIDYIVSTGGEAGTFTCATDEGMEAFIARYASPRLVGIDFDIERGQSDPVLRDLTTRVKAAQARHPGLRFSFTLATWAGTDAARASLNPDGARVLAALHAAGVTDYYVNLMVMDYGAAQPGNCVVAGTVCDMGRSAVQAALNLRDRFGVPLQRIELTPMIGINDVVANVFTLDDAARLARFARDSGLGGVHFWSLDRDVSCPNDARVVSSKCHGLPGVAPFAYARALGDALR